MGIIRRVGATVLTLAVLSTAACSSRSESAPPAVSTPSATSADPAPADGYVALGDSFTAGPGIEPQQPQAGFCQRSTRNWPSLLAKKLGSTEFKDLSCIGATSADLLSTAATAPLNDSTGLVTLGVGGNDGGLFSSLISQCTTPGEACGSFVSQGMRPILDQTVASIEDLITDVRKRAPRARVLLVGYPRLAPPSGTCDALGVPADQAQQVASAERHLELALETAAKQAEIEFISLFDASRGHDACAGDRAWTNGATVSDDDGIIFHPRRAGMRAIATIVQDALASAPPA